MFKTNQNYQFYFKLLASLKSPAVHNSALYTLSCILGGFLNSTEGIQTHPLKYIHTFCTCKEINKNAQFRYIYKTNFKHLTICHSLDTFFFFLQSRETNSVKCVVYVHKGFQEFNCLSVIKQLKETLLNLLVMLQIFREILPAMLRSMVPATIKAVFNLMLVFWSVI